MHSPIKSQEFRRRALKKMAKARSALAPVFRAMCRFKRIRSLAIHAICRLEGGQFWSVTYRELMHAYYGVDIGMHSYGFCLHPGRLPTGTRVGNYCSLGDGLLVLRRNHPVDRVSQHPFFFNANLGLLDEDTVPPVEENPLTIGHDVWTGCNVTITPSCRQIGDSAIIASGAVVTADVPPFAIVGGIPARLIRWRLPKELRAACQQERWWLRPVSDLAGMIHLLTEPLCLDGSTKLQPSSFERGRLV